MTERTLSNTVRLNRDTIEILLIAYQIPKRVVAEKAGISPVSLSKALRNRRDASQETRMAALRAIAALTGRDPEALVMGRLAA
jgi:hypothetical protein